MTSTAAFSPELAGLSFPSGWTSTPLTYALRRVSLRDRAGDELLSVYREFGVIRKAERDDNFNKPGSDLSAYLRVSAGDLVVNKMKAWQGSLGVSPHDGIVSPAYYVFRVSDAVDGRFLHHALRSEAYHRVLERLSSGVRPGQWDLDCQQFLRVPLFFPSPEGQRAIADFLDRKTAAIDELIRKKERLIELLEEKRQALITQAVTKGLDPNVPMKDSGVEWIGEVPGHWRVCRVKHLMTRIVDCPHSTPDYTDAGEYAALRTADVERGRLLLDSARRVSASTFHERNARLAPAAGDIIYSREGERFGMAAPVPEGAEVCLAQRVMLFRVAVGYDPDFIMWTLNADATFQQARQDTVGATSPRINMPTICNAWIAAPPLEEQRALARQVRSGLARLDEVVAASRRSAERLREYRQALITAAVTGQLDIPAESPA